MRSLARGAVSHFLLLPANLQVGFIPCLKRLFLCFVSLSRGALQSIPRPWQWSCFLFFPPKGWMNGAMSGDTHLCLFLLDELLVDPQGAHHPHMHGVLCSPLCSWGWKPKQMHSAIKSIDKNSNYYHRCLLCGVIMLTSFDSIKLPREGDETHSLTSTTQGHATDCWKP